jgi:hypothetical protein
VLEVDNVHVAFGQKQRRQAAAAVAVIAARCVQEQNGIRGKGVTVTNAQVPRVMRAGGVVSQI